MSEVESATPSTEILETLDWAGMEYMVVKTALELDVFTTIAAGHHSLEDVARTTRCSERGMRALLDALCPIGLLAKLDNHYHLTPSSEAFLVRGVATHCADAYLTWWQSRERLTECVWTGQANLDLSSRDRGGFWSMLVAEALITWPQAVDPAREMWQTLGVDVTTRPGPRLLDVACGSGVKGFVLAQADPTARVTALDFRQVLEVSTQVAQAMGVSRQVTFCPGDMLTAELGAEQFDIVLLSYILYYFNPQQVREILLKAYHALRAGGLLVVRAVIADDGRCEAKTALVAALELLHDAPNGQIYTFAEYRRFLEQAGFADVTVVNESLIKATKPQ